MPKKIDIKIALNNFKKIKALNLEHLNKDNCWLEAVLYIYFHFHPFCESRYFKIVDSLKCIVGKNRIPFVHHNPKPTYTIMQRYAFEGVRLPSENCFLTAELIAEFLTRGPLWTATDFHDGHDIVVMGVTGSGRNGDVYYVDNMNADIVRLSLKQFNTHLLTEQPKKIAGILGNKILAKMPSHIFYHVATHYSSKSRQPSRTLAPQAA
jgi:hypothetical protein